jgi:hypothetical protein
LKELRLTCSADVAKTILAVGESLKMGYAHTPFYIGWAMTDMFRAKLFLLLGLCFLFLFSISVASEAIYQCVSI